MGQIVFVFYSIVVTMFFIPWMTCSAEPLLLVDQGPSDALIVGCKEDGILAFQIVDETRAVSLPDLIRWSNPQENLDHHEVVLVDGSRLVLAKSWSGKKSLQISADTITLRTVGLGDIAMPRSKLRSILLNAPENNTRRTRLRDQLVANAGKNDRICLTNGDTLSGRLVEIAQSGSVIKFNLDGTSEAVSLPTDRVAGISFGSLPVSLVKGSLAIGLSDGSYLVANSLVAEAGSLSIKLACAVQLTAGNLHEVVYLQSLSTRVVYLSDLEATDYRHEPFLDIPWQYQRDRSLSGGPLTVGQLIYAKGLAVHAASRLTYDLSAQSRAVATPQREKSFHRFVAQVAIDDASGGRGSVVFQVFLRQAGELQLALTTPVIRAGNAPLPISVNLGDAEQIVLVVEYADRGDQGDYANWLDARLE